MSFLASKSFFTAVQYTGSGISTGVKRQVGIRGGWLGWHPYGLGQSNSGRTGKWLFIHLEAIQELVRFPNSLAFGRVGWGT